MHEAVETDTNWSDQYARPSRVMECARRTCGDGAVMEQREWIPQAEEHDIHAADRLCALILRVRTNMLRCRR